MTSPVSSDLDPHSSNVHQLRDVAKETEFTDGQPPTSFRRKWRLILTLLIIAVLIALPERLFINNEANRHGIVSALMGFLPTFLLVLCAWIVLREVVTSRRVMWWFVCGILLGLAANVLNIAERIRALQDIPLIGNQGAFHGLAEAVIEISAYVVFFLAFAKSILTLREVSDLAERRNIILQEDAKLRAQLQDGFITERNEARWLADKLADLHEIAIILSESTGVHDLCHRAVVVGHCRLGFERVGIWLLGELPGHLYGTYGVDEKGVVRDERHRVIPYPDHFPAETEVLQSRGPLNRAGRKLLRNDIGEVVGEGDHAVAALWDGDSVVGEIAIDNLFSGASISPASLQLLYVYANVIGHLLAQKRLEESLKRAKQVEDRLHTLLSALHQVTLELATLETVDDLCRESVRVGKARLGFSRVEIRLTREGSDNLIGTYCTSEDSQIQKVSNTSWDLSSLDPVSSAALSGGRRPVSACLLGDSPFDAPSPGQRWIWRNAVPLGAMEKNSGLLIMDHFIPNEALSIADLEIAFLFGESLSHLLHARMQEEQRRKWADQLAQTQRLESLGTLAGGIAHDFNNILGAMIGFTEMAIADTPPDSSVRDMQEQVLRAGFRAKELVRQILTFSRRKAISSSEPILPHLIVKEALNLVRASVPSTIRIQTDIQRDCGYVLAEPTHIHQIVMNLCTNAYQAMRDKGNFLEVILGTVDLPEPSPDLGLPAGQYIRLLVRDNGIGMDYETLQRAIEPFFTTKPAGEGTGLGLSTVQGIASSLGGSLQITSAKGEGTTAEVYLPRCSPLEVEEISPIQDITCEYTGRRVLVVDDEVAVSLVAVKQLERLGQTAANTTSPLEALDIIRSQPDSFDLLITDLTMPDMTGMKLAEGVHEIRSDLPIILMSGNLDPQIGVEQERAVGIVGVLQKPVAFHDLSQCLNQVFSAMKERTPRPEWPTSAPTMQGMVG